jgi:hypothetical protein
MVHDDLARMAETPGGEMQPEDDRNRSGATGTVSG